MVEIPRWLRAELIAAVELRMATLQQDLNELQVIIAQHREHSTLDQESMEALQQEANRLRDLRWGLRQLIRQCIDQPPPIDHHEEPPGGSRS